MSTRLFAAIVPPEDVVEHLDDFLDVRRASADFRWSLRDQLHLTLAFMAEVPEAKVDDYVDRLALALEGVFLDEIRLAGAVTFPHPAEAKVLAVGVRPTERQPAAVDVLLDRATNRARNAAVNAGLEVDGGAFRPHVTIARMRRPAEVTSWVRLLETYEGPPWTPYDVTVIASHLGDGPGGRPRYETVAEVGHGG
jgi:2'-5' RNA ligase